MARFACATVLVLAVVGHSVADDARPRLRHNPFDGPTLDAHRRGSSSTGDAFRPILKATSHAGENSIANLGGIILRIGEEAHGYKLITVGEGEAEFERAGTRIVLRIPGSDRSQP